MTDFNSNDSRKDDDVREEDRLLNIDEAARFLNVAASSLYHMIARPGCQMPVIRLSARCVRFRRRALIEWVDTLSRPNKEKKFEDAQTCRSKSAIKKEKQ
jgi:predicted DNA-binding transcriptional regulator AlpA